MEISLTKDEEYNIVFIWKSDFFPFTCGYMKRDL